MKKEELKKLLDELKESGEYKIIKLDDCAVGGVEKIEYCFTEKTELWEELNEKHRKSWYENWPEEQSKKAYEDLYYKGFNHYGISTTNLVFSKDKLNKLYNNKLKVLVSEHPRELVDILDFTGDIGLLTQLTYGTISIGNVGDVIDFYLLGVVEFVSHGVGKLENGYAGWTHRGFHKCIVGEKIEYNPGLVILSHGYIEGCAEYEEEEKEIQNIKDMFENDVLHIKDMETAKLLAWRYSDALS